VLTELLFHLQDPTFAVTYWSAEVYLKLWWKLVPQCSTPCYHLAGSIHFMYTPHLWPLLGDRLKLVSVWVATTVGQARAAYSAYVKARCGLNQCTTVILTGRGRHFSGILTKYQIAVFYSTQLFKIMITKIFIHLHNTFRLFLHLRHQFSYSVTDNSA
jgi:hypothetical protein